MKQDVLPALSSEALYTKSKLYIQRGHRAKKAGDLEEYQLWASLALELLAKSSLSNVHPALVADPTHFQSLFAACGRTLSPDVKTITAKTLFERLSHTSKAFDKRTQKFCESLAMRRNSELHSGESPFSGMNFDTWEKQFWHAIQLTLSLQDKDLDSWLGFEDSKSPKQIISEANHAIKMAVRARIDNALEDFKNMHKSEKKRKEIISESKNIRPWEHYKKLDINIDSYEIGACPACSSQGILGGILWEEIVSDEIDEYDPFIEYVEKIYSSEEFLCIICGFHLFGLREIEATNLPEEFSEIDEREREIEPDYGND